MKAMLGGMTMARPEVTDTVAAANGLSYPALAMPGIRMSPSAATVAGPEPLTFAIVCNDDLSQQG